MNNFPYWHHSFLCHSTGTYKVKERSEECHTVSDSIQTRSFLTRKTSVPPISCNM